MDADVLNHLRRARQGDVEAFGYVAAAFSGQLVAWARPLCRNAAEAEDAAQEALLVAFRSLDQLREDEAFAGWLRTLARTAALRGARRQRPDLAGEGLEAAAEPEPDALESAELKQAVQGAVRELSPGQQAVMERYYMQGQKVEEIAAALGVPAGTVKRRLFEAREKLRTRLAGFGPADTEQDGWRG
ncbi:MAG: sigma-70 family RNA polymerase sigma factor [Planctomycetes bacterium]|jgi:NitT/TauT family transport system substrate-binding protein|nr:sigma-70 family RNA polymerase sigma factor [Planctomycetota bacterium]MCL4729937.1 sigma-70 family RNA polymerase sigma factor [Planctomycetota bacterium]